jgi:hypothetical protein
MNTTTKFFAVVEPAAATAILKNIAGTFGITEDAAYEMVAADDADDLCRYVTGSQRAVCSALMDRHGM